MNNDNVKILQIGLSDNIGGIETYIIEQFRSIDKSKLIYDFIKNNDSDNDIAFANEIREMGGSIYSISSRRNNPIIHYIEWIKFFLNNKGKYKGLVINTLELTYTFPLIAGWLFGVPIRIIHSHNSGTEKKRTVFRRIFIMINYIIMLLFATDRFACSNMAGRWMFGNGYTIVHNAVNVKKFIPDDDVRNKIRTTLNISDKFVVGNIARFSYQKNHDFLIDIFYEIYKRNNSAVLLLLGASNAGEYKCTKYFDNAMRKIKKYGLEKSCIYLGVKQESYKYYKAMDVFVLPSLFEGLSVSAVEAQASGLNFFCSDRLTEETKIVDSCYHQIPLNKSAKYWADKICGLEEYTLKDTSDIIRNCGYDSVYEAKKIEKYFTLA